VYVLAINRSPTPRKDPRFNVKRHDGSTNCDTIVLVMMERKRRRVRRFWEEDGERGWMICVGGCGGDDGSNRGNRRCGSQH